jgi:hypothetical protein
VQAARLSFVTAYFDEQRREKAEARVPFLLVTYSLGKQRKVTRLVAKENAEYEKKYRLELPARAPNCSLL